jgi:dCMP deaminase
VTQLALSRLERDELGLRLALLWAERGTCARRKVGCVLFDVDGYQLSSGYNGPAAGQPHCIDSPCPGVDLPSGTGLSKCEAVHAEANALLRCGDPRRIHVCFVTASPCVDCVKLLLNTSCQRIVFVERYAHDAEAQALWTKTLIHRVDTLSTEITGLKTAVFRTWEQGVPGGC